MTARRAPRPVLPRAAGAGLRPQQLVEASSRPARRPRRARAGSATSTGAVRVGGARTRGEQGRGDREVGEGEFEPTVGRERSLLAVHRRRHDHGAGDGQRSERVRYAGRRQDAAAELAGAGDGRHQLAGLEAQRLEAGARRIEPVAPEGAEQLLGAMHGEVGPPKINLVMKRPMLRMPKPPAQATTIRSGL